MLVGVALVRLVLGLKEPAVNHTRLIIISSGCLLSGILILDAFGLDFNVTVIAVVVVVAESKIIFRRRSVNQKQNDKCTLRVRRSSAGRLP